MDYTLDKLLGKGQTGEVFLATNKDGKQVVIKKIFNRMKAEKELEIARVIHCEHVNLLCLLDFFVHNSINYLVYEYVENTKDLFDCLFESQDIETWSDIKILRIMYSICEGLNALHSKKILHLDIKPENILIKKDEVPIIIDYDLGCLDKNCAKAGLAGTFGYIAPEILNRDKISTKSDVFSLGGTFYCILCKNMPNGNIERSFLADQNRFPIRRVTQFEEKLNDLLTGMLKGDLTERLSLKKVMKTLAQMIHAA